MRNLTPQRCGVKAFINNFIYRIKTLVLQGLVVDNVRGDNCLCDS